MAKLFYIQVIPNHSTFMFTLIAQKAVLVRRRQITGNYLVIAFHIFSIVVEVFVQTFFNDRILIVHIA